jgi:hypothetical protein
LTANFYLCLQPPELSGLNISWSEVLDLPVGHRNTLLELLDEQRSKEISAAKRAMRKI